MPAKMKDEKSVNFLFVSDFHMSLGKDPLKKSYNMREDFFFDEEFFRFLRWADKNRVGKNAKENGTPWELVFVGDCFDFLPIDKFTLYNFNYYKKVLPSIHTMDYYETKTLLEEFFQAEIPIPLKKRLIKPYLRSDILPQVLHQIEERPAWVDEYYQELLSKEADRKTPENGSKIPGWLNQDFIIRSQMKFNQQVEKTQQQVKQQLKSALGHEKHDLFSEDSAVGKLNIIHNGHPRFFEALAWWVARGNRIVVMAGNHDLELRWPAVQKEFVRILEDVHCSKKDEWAKTDKISKTIDGSSVDFKYYWFYFKPGVFYAQHGSQFDKTTSTVNLMNPFWEKGGKKLLFASFGSYGDGLVSEMEDYFPEWDNAKTHGPTLIDKIKNYPYRVPKILLKNIALQLWYAIELFWGTRGVKKPNDAEIQKYLKDTGIWSNKKGFKFPLELARDIYESWDAPLLYHQRSSWVLYITAPLFLPILFIVWLLLVLIFAVLPVIRFVLSPKGFLLTVIVLFTLFPQFTEGLAQEIIDVVKSILGWIGSLGNASQRLVIIENIEPFIQTVGILGALALLVTFFYKITENIYKTLTGKTKKFFQLFTWGEEKYIQEAGREVYHLFKLSILKYQKLREEEMPRSFIFGHDHSPFSYVLNKNDDLKNMDEIFYFNTGAWQSWFTRDGRRRLRTGGSDLEFTFLRIWQPEGVKVYKTDLLRWDNEANQEVEQIVFETKEDIGLIKKIFEGWILPSTCQAGVLGLIIGFFMNSWVLGLIIGALAGVLVGLGYKLWAKNKLQY